MCKHITQNPISSNIRNTTSICAVFPMRTRERIGTGVVGICHSAEVKPHLLARGRSSTQIKIFCCVVSKNQ